jgi:YYY domain-containing protein
MIAILLIAIAFRFHDINWDQGRLLHPDERYVGVLTSLIRPPDSLSQFFNSGASPFNPLNTDWGRSYVYGTLPLFVGRYAAEWLNAGCGEAGAALPRLVGELIFGADAQGCNTDEFLGFNLMTLVGRALSALFDTITVLVVYLLGRRLFGWRVGLLAAGLSAITVLQIQQAHYFTVDAAAATFSTLAMYFSARIATQQIRTPAHSAANLGQCAVAGVMAGLAIACKISVWPLTVIIVVSVVIALMRDQRRRLRVVLEAWLALILAGMCTFAAFRIAQPYAFVGNSAEEWAITLGECSVFDAESQLAKTCAEIKPLPENIRNALRALPEPARALFAPSARWIASLDLAQGFVNGTIDAPFGIQWANRMPVVFPLINLVFYGMGIPLALAAIVGFFYATRQLLRGVRWWAYAPIVLWTGAYFIYQSTQWTKSIRYLLPIYPQLCVLAAVGLMALWRISARNTQDSGQSSFFLRRPSNTLAYSVFATVIGGTLVWVLAFMQIYAGEITRVQASRWVYDHVPTAVTMLWRDGNTERHLQLPIPDVPLRANDMARGGLFKIESTVDGVTQPITGVSMRLNNVTGAGEVEARIFEFASGTTLQTVKQQADTSKTTFVFDQVTLQPDVDYAVEFSLLQGNALNARTSIVVNEHWDDAVPQPLDGKDPYGSYYRGLKSSSDGQIQNYNNDNEEKRQAILNWLDEADYLVLSSNRLYGSIPRLPWRFPMATEYYRALLDGEMGFELVADFNSFPRIGPFKFNDQEMPQVLVRTANTQGTAPGIEVPYPNAEEAFSVYDHPRVLIFKKTTYTRTLGEQLFGKYDLARVIYQSPLDAANTPGGMLLDQRTREAQQAGGTWRDLFPRTSPLNQSQPLAVLAWVALIQVIGIAAFMLMAVATQRWWGEREVWRDSAFPTPHSTLLDGGYAFAKTLGLLLVAVTAWWLGSVRMLPFTPMALWFLVGTLVIAGAVIGHLNRNYIIALFKQRWPMFVTVEALFIIAFVFFLMVRAGNPDLWHPYFGGEKPMDYAYFNGILKATWFPPQDPWFAGGAINYYYFGFVLMGAPVKVLGIDPAVAYNIVIPTLFALTACGAFGLAASFYASSRGRSITEGTDNKEQSEKVAVRSGLSLVNMRGAIIAGLIAAVFVVLVGNGDQIRVVGPGLQQLGGASPEGFAPFAFVSGVFKWLGGAQLPIAPWWPYWNPTRPAPEVMIAEFPQFTFLYADLHAHMMAMPIAFLALAFALAFAGGARKWPAVLMGAIATGMLWPTNTWDYPPYVLLSIAGLALGAFAHWPKDAPPTPGQVIATLARQIPIIVVFAVITRAVMVPYLMNYGAAYNNIDPWEGTKTQLNTYITIYALFLIPLAALLLAQLFAEDGTVRRRMQVALAAGIVAGIIVLIRGVPVAVIAAPMTLLALGAALLPNTSSQTRLLWLTTCGAWALTIFVELFVLRGDIERMNTQFKFYIQAWLMLAVASAVALVWVGEKLFDVSRLTFERSSVQTRVHTRRTSNVIVRLGFVGAVAIAFFLAALYPVFAIPAKVEDRYVKEAPRGLDGMAYMPLATREEEYNGRTARWSLKHDYDAIRWMQDNVVGSPTIIEEGAARGNQYRWSARFAIYTGLPAVVGWQWHQQQQRTALSMQVVSDRVNDVTDFYSTPGIEYARALLQRYNVRYVILGEMEKLYNDQAGLPKFEQMVESGELRIAYQNEGVTIYEVLTPNP